MIVEHWHTILHEILIPFCKDGLLIVAGFLAHPLKEKLNGMLSRNSKQMYNNGMTDQKELDQDLQPIFGKYNPSTQMSREMNITERITLTVQELRNLQKTMTKQIESQQETTRTVSHLTETIKGLDKKNEKLQDKLFWLTVVTVVLAVVTVGLTAAQVIPLFWPRTNTSSTQVIIVTPTPKNSALFKK